ncbi:ribbon-helix-helix domain-containing protein [Tepidicaulis sp. LMO-SS28]|uniref:ribbon-helix-helix domain-containing protein n=1 Tax=Tepidicaulis sp. LMO-SS28 TaxID=3447455 RepID=UPI003EDF4F28
MTAKISISVTDEHLKLLDDAVASGDYASTSEAVREALREWRIKRVIGQLWDEGLASGRAPETSISEIKALARRKGRKTAAR